MRSLFLNWRALDQLVGLVLGGHGLARTHHNGALTEQERVAHAKMVSHEFLSADRNMQRTTFEGGIRVTVDFAAETYEITPEG